MPKTPETVDTPEKIVEIDVQSEMETSFLEYAYSVIYSRALPDARDGLKPVQRRILFQMHQMGLSPSKSYVKSARVTGEVMGKLHPHGDVAIYDAIVRLAQDFTMRLPLVDGHGNFGSLDDGPAAARYTEVRLADAAMAMNADIGEDVVDFIPNYDNKLTQPEVLPAAIPNLLVNGASGIAVGMATNMAPHNLAEVMQAAQYLLQHPKATLNDILRFVPGPDLPGGGKIVGLDGVRQAYETGRGIFRVRAKCEITKVTPRRQGIVVTELPYLIGPERVIERIKDGVQNKRLSGIANVHDYTDRHNGLRLVIELKSGYNPQAVLAQLYRYTPLEDSFGINNVTLVNGMPRTLGLLELLNVWIQHRLDVTERRSRYRLQKAEDRLHLVEGLLIAILDIDEVIQIIRSSEDSASAKSRLQQIFDLSEIQAEYILELRLRRLTKFSQIELQQEKTELEATIAGLREILSDREKLKTLVSQEMGEVIQKFGEPRRTMLLESDIELPDVSTAKRESANLKIADGPTRVFLTQSGKLARLDDPGENAGVLTPQHEDDFIVATCSGSVRADVGVITNLGKLYRVPILELPALVASNDLSLSGAIDARAWLNDASPAEVPIGLQDLSATDAVLALATRQGVVKRVRFEAPKRDQWSVITLADGDTVVRAISDARDSELVFVSRRGQLLRYSSELVRPQGLSGGGIAGISLADEDEVLLFAAVSDIDKAMVATLSMRSDALAGTQPGMHKVTALSLYPPKGRATRGVRVQRFTKNFDALQLAEITALPSFALTSGGKILTFTEMDERRDGSGEQLEHSVKLLG